MNRKWSTVLLILVCSCACAVNAEPQWESWFTARSGAYARIYNDAAAAVAQNASITWSKGQGTQSQPTYAGVHEIRVDDTWFYVRTTGLGFHIMGPWPANFPNHPANTATIYRFPRVPVIPVVKDLTDLGTIGVFVDGVSMFDSRDAFSYDNAAGVDRGPMDGANRGDGIWNKDAYVNEGSTFDPALAHQAGNNYHYHANPIALRHLLGDQVDYDPASNTYTENPVNIKHSPIVGWVRDGHPVYGPYGYSNATNANSGVRRMISGFQLRDGSNGSADLNTAGRQEYPAWAARAYRLRGNDVDTALLTSEYGPNVSAQFELGNYVEDWAYKGDLGMTQGVEFDLDEHNGRFCITPDFPQGVYAYFVSIHPDGTPAFPYNIGRTYFGSRQGGRVNTIPEMAETIFEGGPETPDIGRVIGVGDGITELIVEWSLVQGADDYVFEYSTNMVDWIPIAGSLETNGHIITMHDPVIFGETKKYYRTTRSGSVTAFDDNGFVYNNGGGGNAQQVTLTFDDPGSPPVPPLTNMAGNPIEPLEVLIGGEPAVYLSRPDQYTMLVNFDPVAAGLTPGSYAMSATFPRGPNPPVVVNANNQFVYSGAP